MAYFVEPGHISMVMLTPEQYIRMYHARGPSMWPVYFGARMAAQTVQDLAMKALQVDDIQWMADNIEVPISAGFDVARKQVAAGVMGDPGALFDDIRRLVGGLYANWKAGIWRGMGGAYSSAIDNFLATGQLIYAYKILAYHIAVTPRMRRYYNNLYTPMVPDASMAYILYKRGHFSKGEFQVHARYDGWDDEGAEQLLAAMELLPSPREAFYLWKKGLIPESERNAYYRAGGYDDRYHDMITDNWYYVPTFYDMMRLADYIELDQVWTVKNLRKRGLRDSDIGKVWPALRDRSLRDEIRDITSKWLWRFKYGRVSLDDLRDNLIELGIQVRERTLLLEKAAMDYEDELIDEMVDILMWRFRTARITEEDYLEGLVALGICEEKANLMVELEKAKGYYGYY